jgi:hypothetical protein
MNVLRVLALAAGLVAAASVPASAATPPAIERPTRPIAIVINGEPLESGVKPQVVGERLLVPVRDVLGALGIAIERRGNQIAARLPTGSVKVTVGSATASVNGSPVTLDAPVVDIGGATYAPLRLLTAALGAQVSYDQRGARVEIVSVYVGRNSGAETARADGGTDVQGVVSAVDATSVPPAITVLRAGQSRTVAVHSDAKIYTVDVTIHSQLRAKLEDVRVGDALHAILGRDGRVVSIYDFFKSTSGTVTALSTSALVLQSGRVVIPNDTTEITLDAADANLPDLQTGDFVTVRSNPETGELREIIASRPLPASATIQPTATGPANVAISSFSISATRPLHAGERFEVALGGTPGGRATFDIGDYLGGIPMREVSRGAYRADFSIPDRFNVTQVPVYGHLSVGNSIAPRLKAAQQLSAATTPPVIGEIAPPPGQTVNNTRPSIFATFAAPTGIAINPSSVTLQVGGHDVTAAATRTNAFITYSPGVDLGGGQVTVTVRVADAAGNTASRSWSFSINAR